MEFTVKNNIKRLNTEIGMFGFRNHRFKSGSTLSAKGWFPVDLSLEILSAIDQSCQWLFASEEAPVLVLVSYSI
jgi:hypothetical protein